MPSFGVLSSMPLGSSSLSPCISTLVSSNTSSGPGTSRALVTDGCMSHLFGSSYLPPPPPLSLSDAAPYSPPPTYPPVFPLGPPLLPSASFPPPPPPSFARPNSNITFFEGPRPHYPPEPHTGYDRWSDRNGNSTPYGGEYFSKSFPHWPLPTFNSSININGNNSNNPNFGFLKPEPLFPHLAPYPAVDSVTNFGPKFSSLPGFPNAAGMSSTPSASITSPLASSHFGAFPPPHLPFDFPHSSGRFPFYPHASTFFPSMDPTPPFGPGTAEFMPEPLPSYLSCPGAYQPSGSFQSPDYFHDPFPHPILSPETTPRPLMSDSPSSFYGPPPQTRHGSSDFLSHTFSSRSDDVPGPLCSSEGAPFLDFSSCFPAPLTLPCLPPNSGSLFTPYSSAPLAHQDWPKNGGGTSSLKTDEELRDRIVGETGKLMYQHMSPEEWRWKYYEPSFAEALDPSGVFARVRPSGYNHFHGSDSTVYSAVPNSSNGFVVTEEGTSSGASKSEMEQDDIMEGSEAQNQLGPSLKLAASALAEMLATGPNGASGSTSRSRVSQVEATSGPALTFDGGFQSANSSDGGQANKELMLEDCCSSSGSAVGRKEGRDGSSSLGHEFWGLTAEGLVSALNLDSPTRNKREISDLPEDTVFDFGGATAWTVPKASGKIRSSTNARPMNLVDAAVPQSAKGGALNLSGRRRVFSKGSAGIMRQPTVTAGSTKVHGANAESNSPLGNDNIVFTQSSDLSSGPQSESIMRNVSSPPSEVQPSEDPTSVTGPFASTVTAASGLSLLGPHQQLFSGKSTQLPLNPSPNGQWHVNSISPGSSPPLSQAYLDQQRSVSRSVPTMGATSRVFANLKRSCPESSSQTEVACLGSGFHSLTASISNLSKVLFSLDLSAPTPPDSAALEQTLQSSILRLSECLLLEQLRMNKNPTTRFVGSDESSSSRQGRADGPLPDSDLGRHAETVGSTNLGHLKASDVGILSNVSHSGSPSLRCNSNDLRATGSIASLETIYPNSDSLQMPLPSKNVSDSVSKRAMDGVGVRVGKASRQGCYKHPKRPSSSQQKGVVDDNIVQRLIDAEEREAKLKIMVEELRKELELERVENRGTALLCKKIMQEAEVSKGKEVINLDAQKADLESKKGSSILDRSCKSKASGLIGQVDVPELEKGLLFELGGESDSTAQVQNSEGPFLNEIERGQSLLALLRASQLKIANDKSGSDSREDMDVLACGNNSADAVLDNSDKGEPQQTLLTQPAGHTTTNTLLDTSRRLGSQLAVLQTKLSTVMHEHYSHDANTPANPAAVDLETGRGSFSGHSLPGFKLELASFEEKALKGIPHITAQLLMSRETVSSMHTALSQFSESVNSMSLEKESNTEPQQKEADMEISNATAALEYDGIQAIEERAHLIRTRPDWTEGDVLKSGTEDFLAGQVCKTSSTTSDCIRYESDQFETMREVSLGRLLDSDVKLSQPLQGRNTADCPTGQGAIGDTGRVESSNLESGIPTLEQDIEDDSDSWEHVCLPQKDSE